MSIEKKKIRPVHFLAQRDKVNFDANIETVDQGDGKKSLRVKKFSGVAYSGKVVPVHGWHKNLYIDLDTSTFKDEMPAFRNHNPDKVAGKLKLNKVNNELHIQHGEVFGNTHGEEIIELSDYGLKWELSVGTLPGRILFLEEGTSAIVNGQEVNGPATVLKDVHIYETSFVPVGADKSAWAEIFSHQEEIEVEIETLKNPKGVTMTLIEKESAEKYEFSCACGTKKSVSQMDKDLTAKDDEIKKLKSELSEAKKAKKKADVKAMADEHGVKLTAELEEKLLADDKACEMFFEGAKLNAKPVVVEKAKPVKTNLSPAVKEKLESTEDNEGQSVESNDPDALIRQAKKLSAEKGITMDEAFSQLK